MLPLIMAGGVCVVLVVGAGLFTLFRGGAEEPAVARDALTEQTQPTAPIANTVRAENDVVESNQAVAVGEAKMPLDEANPVSVSTRAAPGVDSDEIRPPEIVALERLAKIGETPAVPNSDAFDPELGVQSILGRTSWIAGGALDSDGFTHPAVVLIIDVQADFLAQVADYQLADITVTPVGSQQALQVYDLDTLGGLLMSGHFVPYRYETEDGVYGHPEGWLRVGIPVAIPEATTTGLAVHGNLLLRVGANREVIQIDDVRASAGKPLEHPSLRAAKAMLKYQSVNRPPFGFREIFDFWLDADYAVGKLYMKSSGYENWMKPHFERNSQRVYYRTEIRNSPRVQLSLPITLFSELSERSIPFRFEILPMPPEDKRPDF